MFLEKKTEAECNSFIMFANFKVAVVIPCYRVERHIADVVFAIPAFVDKIICVDDASDDGTNGVLEKLCDPRLVILRHERNQDVGGAMITGFKEALKLGADIVVKLDGDGQMDAGRMAALIHPIVFQQCDYAKGNRLSSTADMRGMPCVRLFGNLVLSLLTKAASGYWKLMDPQNGYLAISGKLLKRLNLDKIARDYFFENSMLIEAALQNARIADVVMPAFYGNEKSNLRVSRILFRFPGKIIMGFLRRLLIKNVLHDLSPMVIFLILGLLLFIPGTCLGLWLWLRGFIYPDAPAAKTGTIMLALVPLICGYILIVQAILMDIVFSPNVLAVNMEPEEIGELNRKAAEIGRS